MDVEGDEAAAAALEKEAPSQLEKIIKNGYKGLGLEYFFTAGPDEVRVSLIFDFLLHSPLSVIHVTNIRTRVYAENLLR